MKKRVLSTILALAMVLSMFAVVSFADTLCATLSFAGNGFEIVRYFMDILQSKGLNVSCAGAI